MTEWLTFGFLAALISTQAVAANVQVDFAENVNTRLGASRIVSGWEAELGQWPHQISMRMSNALGQVSACGGSIIHVEWAMTAAHCTAARIFVIVRAGLVNLTQPEYIYETDEWFNHPLYNDALPSVVQPHDIALLKLKRSVTYSPNLQPIRLQSSADANKNYDGEQLIASGYGLTWTGGTSPEVLNWVYLRGISNFNCWVNYGFSSIIVDSTICAIYHNVTSQSTCQGDSGGPMSVVEQDGRLSMVGVASFVSGAGCHTEDPAGFIRPGHYHPWYLEVTGINFDWEWEDSEESTTDQTTETAPPTVDGVVTATAPPTDDGTVTETAPSTNTTEEVTATPTEEGVVTVTAPSTNTTEEVTAPPTEEGVVTVTAPSTNTTEEVTAPPTEEGVVTVTAPSTNTTEEVTASPTDDGVTATAPSTNSTEPSTNPTEEVTDATTTPTEDWLQ